MYTVSLNGAATAGLEARAIWERKRDMGQENTTPDEGDRREQAPESTRPDQDYEIPEDATVIRQVQYAWLWSSMPWVIILGVVYYTEFLIEPVPWLGALITVIILVPRYLAWRRTAYFLTDDALIYQRGRMTGSERYRIPWSNLKTAKPSYGSFGRALGYQTVELMMMNERVLRLPYIPIHQDVAGQVQSLIEAALPEAEEDAGQPGPEEAEGTDRPDAERPEEADGKARPDGPQKYDPDAARFRPDESPDDKSPGGSS